MDDRIFRHMRRIEPEVSPSPEDHQKIRMPRIVHAGELSHRDRVFNLIRELSKRRDYFDRRNVLIFEKKDLFALNELDTSLYIRAMDSIGLSSEGIDTDGLLIDRRGWCKRYAEKHGEGYLFGRVVIVSPNQESTRLEKRPFSFLDRLVEEIYEKGHDLITNITLKEAIIFTEKGNKKYESVDDIIGLNFLKMYPETPLKLIHGKQFLTKQAERIYNDPAKLLDDTLLQEMIKKIDPLKGTYGNLLDFLIDYSAIPITMKVPSFVDIRNGAYCIKTDDMTFIINSKKDSNGHRHEFISRVNYSRIYDILTSTGLAYPDPKRVEQKILTTTADFYWKNGLMLFEMKDSDRELSEKEFNEKLEPELKSYQLLLQEINATGRKMADCDNFSALSAKDKLGLLRVRNDNEVVGRLLSDITESTMLSYKYNPQRFKMIFPEADPLRKRYLLYGIIHSLEKESEHNRELNSWLLDNHLKECEEAGIKFKTA